MAGWRAAAGRPCGTGAAARDKEVTGATTVPRYRWPARACRPPIRIQYVDVELTTDAASLTIRACSRRATRYPCGVSP
ncbi:hypothetical protein GCM10027259_31460 [Micromonospora palomenae]